MIKVPVSISLSTLLTGIILLGPCRPAAAQDSRVHQMNSYLKAEAELGQLNGAVLVAEKGNILVDTAFGFADKEFGIKNTPETRFRVASVTKQFTAMGIMMLSEEGKLNVKDPITRWLDDLPPEWNKVTIQELLRHTSGISDYEGWFGGYTTQAYSDYMAQSDAPARIVHHAKTKPLDFEPGTKFHYSNTGYVLLGYIIQQASGMTYQDFIRSRILKPLSMSRSLMDRSDELIPDRAHGYRLRDNAYPVDYFNGLKWTDIQNAHYQLMSPPQGEAGLVTTTHDLYRWDQALYTEQLVNRATLDSIFSPGLGDYGYGWFIRHGPDGVSYEHSGGLPGFTCDILRIPDSHRTIIVLQNLQRLQPIVRDLASIMRGDSVALPKARHLVASDTASSSVWTGVYHTANGDSVEISMDGKVLTALWRGHFWIPLYPESDGDYYAGVVDGTARFIRSNGSTKLIIKNGLKKTVVQGDRKNP